jgi:DNA-binding GntR family transcriptional regulator
VSEERGTRDGKDVANVYDQLRRSILEGRMRPGAVVSQLELTRDLGVGRTPLREALRMLQHEGLVVARANRRVQVAPLSAADAEELYVMRIALETVALRLTVPQLDEMDIAELEGAMAQMDRLYEAGVVPMDKPHRAFHQRLVSGAGERPAALIAELFDHAERYRLFYGATAPGGYSRRRAEHRAVLEAAAAGDVDAAAEALALHYVRTAQLIFAAVEPDRPLERLRATVASVAPGAAVAAWSGRGS